MEYDHKDFGKTNLVARETVLEQKIPYSMLQQCKRKDIMKNGQLNHTTWCNLPTLHVIDQYFNENLHIT